MRDFPGDISRVTSGTLHCRCGLRWSCNLRNLEQMFITHINGKVCALRRRGMQTHTLFHCWGGVIPGKPPPPPKIPDANALCRGLWEDEINSMDLTALYDRHVTNQTFYPIPRYVFKVKDKAGEETTVTGTIRSVACMGYCVGADGMPRSQWRCLECDSLKSSAAIINAINQIKKKKKSESTPLRHLSWDALAKKYKELRTQFTRMRLRETRRHRTTSQLRDRLQAIGNPTTTVGKLIKHWRWIEAQGSLDDQAEALLTFSENLANATCHRLQIDQGIRKTMRGVRWGVITHKIFGANKARGSRSSNRTLTATFRAGPHPRTVDRHVRKKTFLLDVEDDEQNIIAAAAYYAPLIDTLGLKPGEYVPFETQADETGCNPDVQYCRRRRLILSLCGKISKAGEAKHVCNFNCYPGTHTYESIVDGVITNVHATYITILVLRPLLHELPSMVIRARATCNSFDAAAVQLTLSNVRKHYAKHLTPIRMRETGHGSNGDARRVYSMMRNVLRYQLGTPLDATQQYYRLDTPGFTLGAIKVSLPDGTFYVKDNDSQDAIHKVKLTNRSLLAPTNKKLVFWRFATTRKFFLQLFHNFPRSGKMGHRLRVEDAQYSDRQDFSAVQHRVCLFCRAAMLRLQPRDMYCMRAPGDESGFTLHPDVFPTVNRDPDTMSTLEFLHFVPDEARVYTGAYLLAYAYLGMFMFICLWLCFAYSLMAVHVAYRLGLYMQYVVFTCMQFTAKN